MKFLFLYEEIDFSEYELVMPSVSTYFYDRGIIDVLVKNSEDAKRFAYLMDKDIAPFYILVSKKHPMFEGHMASAELFVSVSKKRAFLQLRSYVFCTSTYFAKILTRFLIKKKFKTVTIVSFASNILFDGKSTDVGAILSKKEFKYLDPKVQKMDGSFAFRNVKFTNTPMLGYFPNLYKTGMTYALMKYFPESTICFVVFVEPYMEETSRDKICLNLGEYFGLSSTASAAISRLRYTMQWHKGYFDFMLEKK